MGTVVDRRGSNKNRLAGSRAKFIERYKHKIRQHIDAHIADKKLNNIGDEVPVNIGPIKEVQAGYSSKQGKTKSVQPGNNKYQKGDKWKIPPQQGSTASISGDGEDGEEDFQFVLTKQEFLHILFENLCLPNFLKKSNKLMAQIKWTSGGYIKHGIPARLAIKKTLENAIARRIASLKPKEEVRFLDDIDLRYRNIIAELRPISHAVVFFVMDVSASMDEHKKLLAKKFFFLLYLFLNKHYTSVEVRFISHTTTALEVDEETFFYSIRNGGTAISPAFSLVNKLIDTGYDHTQINIYVAQVSDGDNWATDFAPHREEMDILLPKTQYFSYLEVDNHYPEAGVKAFYDKHYSETNKVGTAIAEAETDVYSALHSLFGRE